MYNSIVIVLYNQQSCNEEDVGFPYAFYRTNKIIKFYAVVALLLRCNMCIESDKNSVIK